MPTRHRLRAARRKTGLTNMLDRPAVARIAARMGHGAAGLWVHAHRDLYARGVFHGFAVEPDQGGAR